MKHINKINFVLAFALLLSFAFGPSRSTVFAKPEQPEVTKAITVQGPKEPPEHPNCQFSPINVVVPLGKELDFYILNPEVGVDYTWRFDDGNTSVGKNTKHAWSALGNYKMYVTAQGDEYNNSCYTYITVVDPETPVVSQTPEPPAGGNTSPVAGDGTSAINTIDGNNNASNAINCNDCTITINNYPTDQVPPAPIVQTGQSDIDKLIVLIKWMLSRSN